MDKTNGFGSRAKFSCETVLSSGVATQALSAKAVEIVSPAREYVRITLSASLPTKTNLKCVAHIAA
jgi:hypothetical protein